MALPVDHVGVVVHDIDGALPFYRDRLGLPLLAAEELPQVGVRLVYLAAGPTTLQLVEPIAPGPLMDRLAERGEGLHHLCFEVPDIELALRRLAPGEDVSVTIGGRGRRACFLPGSVNGLRIELTECEPVARG